MLVSEEQYVTDRVDPQIQFFTKKSQQHRRRYKSLKIIEIVSGFLIAVCCTIPMESQFYRILSVFLSSLGLLCQGIISLYHAKEHWIAYQKTAQLLEREKFLYYARINQYSDRKTALQQFIVNCEQLISDEIDNWTTIQSKEELPVELPKDK